MKTLIALVLGFFFLSFSPQAEAATFSFPKWNGYGLDWCKTFEHDCGKPAADLWCQKKGYPRSTTFTKHFRAAFQTMTVGNNAICDPRSHHCDSFSSITCQDAVVTIVQPKYHGYRLDWCRVFEGECGAPAANQFCQKAGYAGVHSFGFQGPVNTPTMTVGSNAICDPRFHRCDSFSFVRCRR